MSESSESLNHLLSCFLIDLLHKSFIEQCHYLISQIQYILRSNLLKLCAGMIHTIYSANATLTKPERLSRTQRKPSSEQDSSNYDVSFCWSKVIVFPCLWSKVMSNRVGSIAANLQAIWPPSCCSPHQEARLRIWQPLKALIRDISYRAWMTWIGTAISRAHFIYNPQSNQSWNISQEVII